MTKRIVQLLTRVIAGIALAAFGYFAGAEGLSEESVEAVNRTAEMVAAGIVGLGAVVVDLFIHRAETGSVLAKPGESKVK